VLAGTVVNLCVGMLCYKYAFVTISPHFCWISKIMAPLNSANFTESGGLEKIHFGTKKFRKFADPDYPKRHSLSKISPSIHDLRVHI